MAHLMNGPLLFFFICEVLAGVIHYTEKDGRRHFCHACPFQEENHKCRAFHEADKTQAKIMAVAKELGREIHLFPTSATPSNKSLSTLTSHSGESEDFYDFTKEDYYRVLKHRKEGAERFLKTCKIREAEEAERRSKITKAVIRVCFPNNYTLEAKFHPSETVQSLMDLLMKVVARPDLPFYIHTTPPKKQVKEMSKDFYSLGFLPQEL